MGPQHPSTHGVLRLVLELEGETVTAGPLRDRLPAHRHREELRVPHLDPGRHVRDAHGLPRRRCSPRPATASASRSCSGWRRRGGPSRAACMLMEINRIASHLVGAGHRRHGARRAHRHDQRVPRARGPAAPAGAPHRPADEPRVHPARRPGRRTSPTAAPRTSWPSSSRSRPAARLRQAAHRPADLAPAPGERRLPAARRLPRARRHRPDPARRRSAVGPSQDRALRR